MSKAIYQNAKVTPFASVLSQIPISAKLGQHKTSERLEDTIQRIKDIAYQEGFRLGQDQGFSLGFGEGKRAGYGEGITQANEEIEHFRSGEMEVFAQEVEHIRDELQEAIESWFKTTEEAFADQALEVVRRVLFSELQISRESAIAIAKEALKHVTHASHARIRINPTDSVYFLEHRELLLQASNCLRDCEITLDPTIGAGCIIETDGGRIDARVEKRFELIENEFYAGGVRPDDEQIPSEPDLRLEPNQDHRGIA